MILGTLRVVAEAGGLVASGFAASEAAPYLFDSEYENNVGIACAPLVEQSHSLVAEFMDILRKLEASSSARLTEMCCTDGQRRRVVSKADIDELCANLVNDDAELNSFSSLFVEANMEATAAAHGGLLKIDEKYRIVSTSEMAKLEPLSVNQAAAAPPPSSSSSSSSLPSSKSAAGWYRSSRGGGSGGGGAGASAGAGAGAGAGVTGARVGDVLCLMADRDRLSSDLMSNFELQQQRIRRQLDLKAASCLSPQLALAHSRAVHCSHLAIYLMVCMGLDRFWPQGAGGGGGGGGSSDGHSYAGGSSASSASASDKAVADILRQIEAGDAAATVAAPRGAGVSGGGGGGGEGRSLAPSRGVSADTLSRLFASAPQQRGAGPAPGASIGVIADRWRSAPGHAPSSSSSSSQFSLLPSINGGFRFPLTRPRVSLARALFLYLPAMCVFHYASTSLVSLAVDDGDDEEGAGQWGILAATDLHRPSGHFAKQGSHLVSHGSSDSTASSSNHKSKGGAGSGRTGGGPLEGPDPVPPASDLARGGLLGALESSVRGLVGDADDGDDGDLDLRARAPAVWLGATRSDPFTVQRVLMMVVERPWVDGLLFQGILFLRLLGLGGMSAALLLTPMAYAVTTTDTQSDLRAMLVELRSSDAFLLNLVSGLNFCATFALTQRLWCSVLLDALVTSSYLSAEFRAREDILHSETLSLWSPTVRLLSLIERYEHLSFVVENWLLPVPRLMSKSTSEGDSGSGSASGNGSRSSQGGSVFSFLGRPKATAELRRLSAAVVEGFATDAAGTDVGGLGGAQAVLNAVDLEDLTEGIKQAMVAVDKRPQGELSVFERARRMEYQQYLAAVKIKHKLPEIVKVITKSIPTTPRTSASGSSGSSANADFLRRPFPIVLNDGTDPARPLPSRTDEGRRTRLRALALRELDRLEAALATTGGGSDLPCLRLLFDDARRVSLQAAYPRGASRDQLEGYLAQQLADIASRQYIANNFDVEKFLQQLLKWEKKLATAADNEALAASCENAFLDFLQHYYWSLLCELEWEAIRFARVQIPQFLDSLAGRAATPEDALAYEALLSAHCREAGRRAALMALAPHGLTERRLARLVDAYERRFPAVQALRRQWEDFFRGDKYRKTISDIVNPLATAGPEPHRQGDMDLLLKQAQAQTQAQAQARA